MNNWIKRILRVVVILLGVAAGLAAIAAAAYFLMNHTNGSLVSSGQKRAYLLYVPKTYDPAKPTPLVISLHGYAEWPAHQMQITRWNDLADQHGFIVVYPSGTGFPRQWYTRGAAGSATDPALEVTFISDLIDKLEGEYNLDPARIYANGLSNGGGMSFLLSCRLAGRIAAIGSVSGAYLIPWDECHPTRPVPTMLFHGTADPIVPYQGGPSKSFNLPFPYIPAWVAALAKHNGCEAEPQKLPTQGEVSGVAYQNCQSGADVVFYTIAGGGHAWPDSQPLPAFIVGHTSQDIDATAALWNFFVQHPMPEGHGK
jgi:polyhydroxybutyrate depolymerase